MNYPNYKKRAEKQGSINRKKFTLDKMTEKFDEILGKSLPNFSQQVQLKLPKLNNTGEGKSTLPKLKLPKLKKIETNQVGA